MADKDLIRVGKVISVNKEKNTVKVRHGDTRTTSRELPIIKPKPRPEIGDKVLVVYLSNGDSYGICLGDYYKSSDSTEENIINCLLLPDGASIKYDTDTKTLHLTADHVVVNGTEVGGV